MVKRGWPAVTMSPSATSTSSTVPGVVRVRVSLLLAFTVPVPVTCAVMEPYCTVSVPTSLLPPPLPPSSFQAAKAAASSTTTTMMVRIRLRRCFLLRVFFSGAAGAASVWKVSFPSSTGSLTSAISRFSFTYVLRGRGRPKSPPSSRVFHCTA